MTAQRSLFRRLIPSPMLSIMVVAFWLLMSDSFTLGQIVLGLLLGVVVPLFAARLDREFARIGTLRPLPKLVCVTLWDILMSNIRVPCRCWARRRTSTRFHLAAAGHRQHPRHRRADQHDHPDPGTVSAALSDDRKFLLVHVLHLEDPQDLIDTIKRRYEAPLMEIFP
jgi:multicomponent K+:H+ antiporter subunit E